MAVMNIVNIDNIWIRLEKDLKNSGYILCNDLSKLTIKLKKFYEKCIDKCPSSCHNSLFKVNHYAVENFQDKTILNIIPKYTNELSYIESYRMSIYSLIYEIGDIIGLWLGLSVLSLSDLILIPMRKPGIANRGVGGTTPYPPP